MGGKARTKIKVCVLARPRDALRQQSGNDGADSSRIAEVRRQCESGKQLIAHLEGQGAGEAADEEANV